MEGIMAFFCQSIAVGFSPQRTALIRQTLKRPAMGDDGIFCQSLAVGFSPQRTALIRQTLKRPAMEGIMAFFCQSMQRTALIRQTLKRPAMGDDGIFLSVSSCGLQSAANSAYTPDAEAPSDRRRWHFFVSQ
jgi:hypothetical protein